MLTPQELMDLPGAGAAERKLRSMGKWELTALECLNDIPEDHCSDVANTLIEQAITQLEKNDQ